MLRKALVGSGIAAILLACGSEGSSEFTTNNNKNANQDAGTSPGFTNDGGEPPPAIECHKMDIVFVIDNSSSMEQEQAALASNFPGFIKLINEYKTALGEQLDYRIAIVSTDLKNEAGAFHKERGKSPAAGTCGPGDTDMPWLERHDGIDAEFACRAQLGVLGDNRELPLECTRLGLTQRITDQTNTYKGGSFIREDALLAVIIITDEDEGGGDHDAFQKPSPVDTPENYAKSFDQVKGGYRGRWATAVIAGERYCLDGQFGTADQAVRLQQFADIAKPNSVFSSICSKDFTTSLKEAFDVFSNACRGFPAVK